VSSQAWKHAAREAFRGYLDFSELGTRTKRVVELIAERVLDATPDATEEEALVFAEKALTATGIKVKESRGKDGPKETGYLLFLSNQQIAALGELASEALRDQAEVDRREAQGLIKGKNSVDLALFGRMVADVSDLNVDASCQVAHALSTHGVEFEYDYFTAVDDVKAGTAEEDAGAGMIGTVEFNSATLYRYATLDIDSLNASLGDLRATVRAASAFLQAFVKSMPTGKQNTFANRTLPELVVVCLRDDRPVSWVGAFEEPVVASTQGGYVSRSTARLVEYAKAVDLTYGSPPVACFTTGIGTIGETVAVLGDSLPLDNAVRALEELLEQRLLGAAS